MFFTAVYVCLIGCFSVVTCSPGPTFSCIADNHVNGCNVLPFTPYEAVFTPACDRHDVCYFCVSVSKQIACTCHVTQNQCCHAIFAVYTKFPPIFPTSSGVKVSLSTWTPQFFFHYYYTQFSLLLRHLMAFLFMCSTFHFLFSISSGSLLCHLNIFLEALV